MKIKTVWHWGNIAKIFLMIGAVAILVSLIPATPPVKVGLGAFVGFVGWLIGMLIWEPWHFE